MRWSVDRQGVCGMGKKVTIQMIADASGVSRGTVDRVLHGRSYVHEDVRRRVLEAVRDLGYAPLRGPAVGQVRLGVVIPTWSAWFNQEIARGLADARRDFGPGGVEIASRLCASDLPSEVLQAVDELLAEGVDGLAVAAQDSAQLSARLNGLAEQGFPVVLYNADFPDCRRLAYLGPDVRKTGRVAGELMSRLVGPEAALLTALGSTEIFSHRERALGFKEALEARGFSKKQVRSVLTYNDYIAFQRLSAELAADPSIRGVYLANDTVVGCVEALEALDLVGAVHVICHDLTPDARAYLLRRKIDFVIDQDIRLESYLAVRLLRDHLLDPGAALEHGAFAAVPILCAESLPEDRFENANDREMNP